MREMEVGAGIMKFRNLLLISYDTTRADVAYSGRIPGVERLRRQGVTFRNCVASAPLTPISHATVMTGLQPWAHGIRHLFREQMDAACATLAGEMDRAGFATSAVVSCPGLHRWYGIGRGFAAWDDEVPPLPDGTDPLRSVDVKVRGRALKRAPVVDERSRELVGAHAGRYFHFMHFFDAHWPYEPPSRPFAYEVANDYEAELAYSDHYCNQFLEWMESTGRLKDTLVVLFGDHGEDLEGWYPDDRGGEALGHPEESGHGCLLYDQTVTVPLVISHSSLTPREVTEQVRLVDVMPTCLELMGVTPPSGLHGVSMADAVLGRGAVPTTSAIAYSETHYPREQVEATGGKFDWTHDKKCVRIANRYKVIFHVDSDQVEVYDLESDPMERRNLLAAEGEE